jgi:hypothetical protein
MRAHNVLCNSYNSRDKPLQLSSCTFCVVVHSYSFENCIAYFHSNKLVFYAYRLYFINVWHVYEWSKTYTWSGTFILKDGRYTFLFVSCMVHTILIVLPSKLVLLIEKKVHWTKLGGHISINYNISCILFYAGKFKYRPANPSSTVQLVFPRLQISLLLPVKQYLC